MSEHSSFAFPWFGAVAFLSAGSVFSRPSGCQGHCLAHSRQQKSSSLPLSGQGRLQLSGLRNQGGVAPSGATVGAGTGLPRGGVSPRSWCGTPGGGSSAVCVRWCTSCSRADAFAHSAFISHSLVPGPVLRTHDLNLDLLGGIPH